MFPEVRPEMIVCAREVLNCELLVAANELLRTEPIEWRSIDGGSALAVWGHDFNIRADGTSAGPRGPHPLHLALNRIFQQDADTFSVQGRFPTSRFFAGMAFPGREESHRMVCWCSMTSAEPLRLRLHTYKDLGEPAFTRIKDLFAGWLDRATTHGFHDETLRCSVASIERYHAPACHPLPQQFGWEIVMPQASEVYFPWLELFFRLRRELPKSQRVSFDFSHPS